MDQEWFTFETAGTLVVGWDGGPKRVETRQDRHDSPAGRLPTHESWYSTQPSDPDGARTTGIEIAAAAATGTGNAHISLDISIVKECIG